ncbi:WxcM-like domain-containing protein [Chloroflexota bacterium]
MMYPLNENETGSFQELARPDDVIFGQLSILTVKPTCTRGGHYHTRKEEWFCCLHGRCELRINNVKDQSERTIILDGASREFVVVTPYQNHVVRNPSDTAACELLIIISEAYDPADPDTFKYEG